MTKQLIGTLVAALILFIWQFLSWSALQVHKAEFGYTANQDRIMEALSQNLTEEGTYMLPMPPPGSTYEQESAFMENYLNKPWASVSYHKSFSMSMGMNMTRGLAVDLLAAWLLIWLLLQFKTFDIMTAVKCSLAVGIIGYLTIPYLNSVWFDSNSIGHLIDAIVPWSIVGVWLGWWLKR